VTGTAPQLAHPVAAPENVRRRLHDTLATLLCRGRHQQPAACGLCRTTVQPLVAPIAEALLATERGPRVRPLRTDELERIGRLFESLERAAGWRPPEP
jgi:hypothetical protein